MEVIHSREASQPARFRDRLGDTFFFIIGLPFHFMWALSAWFFRLLEPRLVDGVRRRDWLPEARKFFNAFARREYQYSDHFTYLASLTGKKWWNAKAIISGPQGRAFEVRLVQPVRFRLFSLSVAQTEKPEFLITEGTVTEGTVQEKDRCARLEFMISPSGLYERLQEYEWNHVAKKFLDPDKFPSAEEIHRALSR